MDERECAERTAVDQIGWNIKWWEWGDQEHIQRLRASHATGLTGSCQVNLSSEPVSSLQHSSFLNPHHREQSSMQSFLLPLPLLHSLL